MAASLRDQLAPVGEDFDGRHARGMRLQFICNV
jgi:hypothetical protein